MLERLALYGLSYLTFGLELGLFLLLAIRGQWKNLKSLAGYLVALLVLDTGGRSFFLYRYGYSSPQYAYFYWISDVVLTLAAFLVVCLLFHRACRDQEKTWSYVRLFLVMVFSILVVVSFFRFSENFGSLLRHSIVAFEQNLYFTCLVLNTLLYILLQQIDSEDDQLALLVCGMGTQFAGPTASWALLHLAPHDHVVEALVQLVAPLCTLGMLAIWLYAVRLPAKACGLRAPSRRASRELKEMSPVSVVAQ